MTRSIYIAGPMTGLPDFNFPAFFEAEQGLRDQGWITVNPAREDLNEGYVELGPDDEFITTDKFDLSTVLLWDLKAVADCKATYFLRGWEDSKGAKAEHALAVALGKPILYQPAQKPQVVGIGGRLAAGKDAVADHLVAKHGFVKLGMSDPLLDVTVASNPLIRVTLREALRLRIRPGHSRAKDLVERLGYVEAKTIADFRAYMQHLGTDAGRQVIYEDVWVDVAVRRMNALVAEGKSVVITGVRYPNEVAMFGRVAGGDVTTVWVERYSQAQGQTATHISEQSVDASMFGVTIHNTGSLDMLYQRAERLLNLK